MQEVWGVDGHDLYNMTTLKTENESSRGWGKKKIEV